MKKWTKEECQKEALKYKKKSDFLKGCKSAYEKSRKKKWLEEICKHMEINFIWTKELCLEVIKKCDNLRDFYTNYNSAYQFCIRNGILEKLGLKRELRPAGYWTKEKCLESALSCKNKWEFRTKFSGAYMTCIEKKWLRYIYSKCDFIDKEYTWIVYSYLISNRYVYIGITTNEKSRKSNHLNNSKNSSVYQFIKDNDINSNEIVYKKEVDNITNKNLIKKLEKEYLDEYLNLGFIKINRIKTGNFGGGKIVWTKERCLEIAKKYNTRNEFSKNDGSAYGSAVRNKWLNDICIHMKEINKPDGYWKIKENCKEESSKYSNRIDFRKKSRTAYKYSLKYNWVDEFFPKTEKYTKMICQEEAVKYSTKIEFKKSNNRIYDFSYRKGWLGEICQHMKKH